ncbi:MAG: hypothetical protein AAFN00_21345, partial [Cyanobacteria bacterium J06558_2]
FGEGRINYGDLLEATEFSNPLELIQNYFYQQAGYLQVEPAVHIHCSSNRYNCSPPHIWQEGFLIQDHSHLAGAE